MSPLPRELVRWLQTLDLPTTVRLPKRDLSNGYLFAEMCARYWNSVELHSFENKLSKVNKEANWKVLRRYFSKNQFNVDELLIQGVINCDEGAAEQFLFLLYTALTKREIQIIPAAHEPEVDSVPVFVKSQYTMQQNHSAQRKHDDATTAEQEEQRLAEERARLEAQRRAEAQQRQQHPSKPKTLLKAQAIQAPAGDDDDHDGATHHAVQFSAVMVKPLPPQMLARLGHRGGAADGAAGGAGGGKGKGGAGGAGGDDAPGAVATISATLTKILDEGGLPLWQTSSSVPTAADYFLKNLNTIDPNLRNVMWSQLLSSTSAVAAILIQRPSEFQNFCELLQQQLRAPPQVPAVATAASNNMIASSHTVVKYFTSVISIVSSTNPAVALAGLREAFLPIVRGCCPLSAALADWFGPLILSFIHVVGGAAPVFASMYFSSIFDGLTSPSGSNDFTASSSTSGGAVRSRSDFLPVLHAILEGFASRKRSGIDDTADSRGAAASSALKLNDQCAAVAYYNAVAGLYSEFPKDRLAATKLLTRLVRLGGYAFLAPQRQLRDFTVSLTSSRRASWSYSADGLIAFAQLAEAHLDYFLAEGNAIEDPTAIAEDVHGAVDAIRALAFNDTAVLPSKARQYMLFVLAKATALSPPPQLQQQQKSPQYDHDASLASQLAAYLVHSPFAHEHSTALVGSGDATDDNVHAAGSSPVTTVADSRVLGQVAIPTLLRGACPLRLALGLLQATPAERPPAPDPSATPPTPAPPGKKNSTAGSAPPSSGANSVAKTASRILKLGEIHELSIGRLQWIQALFMAHQDATLAARTLGGVSDEDLVTHWWQVVKQLEPTLGVVLYAAELLASQQQQHNNANVSGTSSGNKGGPSAVSSLPSTEVTSAVFHAAGIAQSLLIRCYIDFSGHILPAPTSLAEYSEIRLDPSIAARATEWFQQVVVEQ